VLTFSSERITESKFDAAVTRASFVVKRQSIVVQSRTFPFLMRRLVALELPSGKKVIEI
jgi:hypothetical protein